MQKLTVVLTIIVVLVLFSASAGQIIEAENGNDVAFEVIKSHGRKVLMETLDYDYGGPNPRHDPRRRPGIGGRNR